VAPPLGSYQDIEALTSRRKKIVWMTERRGMTAREIARELSLTIRTVQRHQSAHRRGIAPKHPGPQTGTYRPGASRVRIVALAEAYGWPARRIAEEVGLSPRTVRHHLARHRAYQQP